MYNSLLHYPSKIYRHLRKKIIYNNFLSNTIMSRTACLGHDLVKLKYQNRKIHTINQQKVRLDLFLEWKDDPKKRPLSFKIKKHLLRKDIYHMIKQQEELPWTKISNFEFLLIDSFAELTDQKFTQRKYNWSFCSHYSDINQTPDFKNLFFCEGLLNLEKMEGVYKSFFEWFRKEYPNKKVFFIHFPTKLDQRKEFKIRGNKILEIMLNLEKENSFIYNINIDESKVYKNETNDFPYHYSIETNKEFLKKLEELEKII